MGLNKAWITMLCLIILLGICGCNMQSSEAESSENAKLMLDYLIDRYGEDFTMVEYIPARRGFNDSMNKNTLVAEIKNSCIQYRSNCYWP